MRTQEEKGEERKKSEEEKGGSVDRCLLIDVCCLLTILSVVRCLLFIRSSQHGRMYITTVLFRGQESSGQVGGGLTLRSHAGADLTEVRVAMLMLEVRPRRCPAREDRWIDGPRGDGGDGQSGECWHGGLLVGW